MLIVSQSHTIQTLLYKLYVRHTQYTSYIYNYLTIHQIYVIHTTITIHNLKQFDNKTNCHFSTLYVRLLTKINMHNKTSQKYLYVRHIVQNKNLIYAHYTIATKNICIICISQNPWYYSQIRQTYINCHCTTCTTKSS